MTKQELRKEIRKVLRLMAVVYTAYRMGRRDRGH